MPRNDESMDEAVPEELINYSPGTTICPPRSRALLVAEPSISGNRIVGNLREEKHSCEARLAAINSLLSRLDGNPDLARMINDARDLGVLY